MNYTFQPSPIALAAVQASGKEAGAAGRPHTDNPHQGEDAELLWFAAWHLATVEREIGYKILPDLPDEESGLLMFSPKKKEDRSL